MEDKLIELVEFAIDRNIPSNKLEITENKKQNKFFKFRKLTKIVYDKSEDNIEKLTAVFNAINNINADVAYVLVNQRTHVDFYIGVITEDQKLVSDADEILVNSLKANFNGCEISEFDRNFKEKFEKNLNSKRCIALTTALPSFKNEDEKKEKFIQSLDKFIKGMEDKNFIGIFLAKNANEFIEVRKKGYEELYTSLYPLLNNDISISESESFTIGETETETFSKTLSDSIAKTFSTQKMSDAQKIQMNLGVFNAISFVFHKFLRKDDMYYSCLLYTSPSPRDS
jgi:hypothetical protein